MKEAYPQVYEPRAIEGIGELIESLTKPPEKELSEEEKQQFFTIEKSLAYGNYGKDESDKIDDWYTDRSIKIDFILEYFDEDEAVGALLEIADSINYAVRERINANNVVQVLAEMFLVLDGNQALQLQLKRLAKKSHDYFAQRICENQDFKDVSHFTLHGSKSDILDSIKRTRQIRDSLRKAKLDIQQRDDLSPNLKEALLVVTGLYMQKTAQRLGSLYPDFVDLYQIAITLPTSEGRDNLISELNRAQEHILKLAERLNNDTKNGPDIDIESRFAWTMDRWRQGLVTSTIDRFATDELDEFIQNIESDSDELFTQHNPAFTSEEQCVLNSRKYSAQDMYDLAAYILAENGVLSQSDNYIQGEWPEDSMQNAPKIGIHIGPYDNLKYSRGWLLIPEGISRKGFQQSPSGAFLVIAHEIEHAIDGITAYQSGGLELSKVTSRGSTAIREGIGKAIEMYLSRELVGVDILPSRTYYRALIKWLETGSEKDAILAFAQQAALEAGNNEPTESQIKNAENRVQRLIGKHGLNTQALVYIEQAVMAHALSRYPKAIRDYIASNSGLDVRTQVYLHRYGVLEKSRYQFKRSTIDCLYQYLVTNYL